ncbi:MAG: DNA polymerase III subunit delta', partial [Myxococcota bacterium]
MIVHPNCFASVRGQSVAVETLRRAIDKDQVHHAYRFEGLAGVGKERTAFAFARALLCERGGCGRCDVCDRLVVREGEAVPRHPDLILVGRALYPPEVVGGKKEANEISVEQIRRIVLGRAGFSPHEGRAQVFIIRGAEQLSLSAANALLKTLEEPRPQTHFVLLTDQPERLLDTIRSRTMPVRFGTLTDEHITAILREHEVPEARIGAAVDLADGSAAAALAFADEEGAAARTAFVESVLAAVAAPNLDAAVELGEGLPRDRH